MYLKAGIAAYKTFEFDSSIKDSVSLALDSMREELNEILSYGECEYAPDYTNQIIIEKLNRDGITTSSAAPSQNDLFDETFWQLCFGQTLGRNYDALFHEDGTFTARGWGSGVYEEGTYSYQDGVLTITFSIFGTTVFEREGDGFVSREKQIMQVGEDYYRISPIEGMSDFYYEGLKPDSPESATERPTLLDELTDGEYYGRLISWTWDSMTIELYYYTGQNEYSSNYEFEPTGEKLVLDISQAKVLLEEIWSSISESDIESIYDSIDSALNTVIWDDRCLAEICPLNIKFTIKDSKVEDIVFLYQA